MGYKIFICYRRDDQDFARNIERTLRDHFGADSVFLDNDEIKAGQRWKHAIIAAFDDNPVVVTLITTRWNSRRDGKPRLLYEKDYVRFELEFALERGLVIVPVLKAPAYWPKQGDIPPSLHAVLEFQKFPFSSDRWDYDSTELVKALTALGVPPVAGALGVSPVAAAEPPVQPAPLPFRTPGVYGERPATWNRSMFTEDREVRLARAAQRAKAERERLAQVRALAEPFYARWQFWLAAVVTVAAGAAAVVGAEVLTQTVAQRWVSLPDPSIVAGILLVAAWGIARIGMGAAAYWYDPSRGTRVFYLRGLLGGYTLCFADYEPIGLWAAFPIPTVLSWCVARGVAWPAYHYLQWSYDLIFWLVLGASTLTALGMYVFMTFDEAV